MSERLRQAYQDKHDREIILRVREKNKVHNLRMMKAGMEYIARHRQKPPCGHCGKGDKLEFIETPEYMHYGKIVCARCKSIGAPQGSFCYWVPYPIGEGN